MKTRVITVSVISVLLTVMYFALNTQPVLGLDVQSMIESHIKSFDPNKGLTQLPPQAFINEKIPIVIMDIPADPNQIVFNPNRGTAQAITIIEPAS